MTTTKFKSRTKKKNKKPYYAIVALFCVIAIAGASIMKLHHSAKKQTVAQTTVKTSTNHINYSPAPAVDNDTNEANKSRSSATSTPATSTTGNPTTTSTSPITVQIVSAVVHSGNLHVGTLVANTTSGACTLTATQPGQTTVNLATSTVKANADNYDCGAFDLPLSAFPSTGTWTLKLDVANNGASGSSTTNITF